MKLYFFVYFCFFQTSFIYRTLQNVQKQAFRARERAIIKAKTEKKPTKKIVRKTFKKFLRNIVSMAEMVRHIQRLRNKTVYGIII